jgi:hypothetical protein
MQTYSTTHCQILYNFDPQNSIPSHAIMVNTEIVPANHISISICYTVYVRYPLENSSSTS